MASQQVVGFVSLDDLSLELAASLLRSGYAVQAFEVSSSILLPGKNVKENSKFDFSGFVLEYIEQDIGLTI